ncbi:DUF4405 domain-containing protein [Qiania dongpingensis]|uniref:DUF4405 domain-containing protein n=1 Tax=Qiania dongpingensis TaxID=2763669 RepID=A0A7G9G3C0_9FIRM|nr:DUF4405 domain-containing protein [Qiania dongpingensis]QNM05302.1 DUF4405 domain-containing protein [Qiania dongpingensis]
MKPKAVIKTVIDIWMTAALLFLMGYQFWGDMAHEWAGAGIFLLFIAHHLLNRNWYKGLFRGQYTPMRIFRLCVNLLTLSAMLALMYSSIVMSRHVFVFLPIEGGMSLARRLHILGAYWGFVLMSLHLGLHWSMFVGMARKGLKVQKSSRVRSALLFAVGLLIAAYGIYAFVGRDFVTYLFLQSEFVFLDYNERVHLFYLDYLALMGLFIFLSHYASKLLTAIGKRKRTQRKESLKRFFAARRILKN